MLGFQLEKTYYTNTMEVLPYKEPVYIKAVVNGLIATSVLWLFWSLFIMIFVVDLISAQLKDGVCHGISTLGYTENPKIDSANWDFFISLHQQGLITIEQAEQLSNLFSPQSLNHSSAMRMLGETRNNVHQENTNTYIFFSIITFSVILGSLWLASYLIVKYNLNVSEIVWFNVIMALIIMIIEGTFFAGVAIQYVPFNEASIIQSLANESVDFLSSYQT